MKLSCVVLGAVMLASLAQADEALLAPIHDGAEPVEEGSLLLGSVEFGGSPEQRLVFLVRDGLDDVLRMYRERGLSFDQTGQSKVSGLTADLYSAEVLEQSQVVRRLNDYTLARTAGVQLLVPYPRESGVYLGALKDSVAKGYHEQAELDRIAAQYAHLESSLFPSMQGKDGKWSPADEVLVDQYYAGVQGGFSDAVVDVNDVAARMQALIAEGRMDEVAALSEEMAGSLDAMGETAMADTWEQGIALLEELDRLAFRLVLIIDRQPEFWEAQ